MKPFETVDKRQTTDPWPRSLNDLHLQNFIGVEPEYISISESTIATEKDTFSVFPIQKPKEPHLTCKSENVQNALSTLIFCRVTRVNTLRMLGIQ